MTMKSEILKAVRRKCLDCSGGQMAEVRLCHLQRVNCGPTGSGWTPTRPRRASQKSLATRAISGGKGGSSMTTSGSRKHNNQGRSTDRLKPHRIGRIEGPFVQLTQELLASPVSGV